MEQNQVAILTVPAQEWMETKAILRDMAEKLKKLTDKEEKELMTPKEVCEFLKIGRMTFERYKNDAVFEVVRVNTKKYSKVYVKRSELERLIKEGVL